MTCRCTSIDGDADRLVFFFQHEGQLQLLDGDRIALLLAMLASQLLTSFEGASDFTVGPSPHSCPALRLWRDKIAPLSLCGTAQACQLQALLPGTAVTDSSQPRHSVLVCCAAGRGADSLCQRGRYGLRQGAAWLPGRADSHRRQALAQGCRALRRGHLL